MGIIQFYVGNFNAKEKPIFGWKVILIRLKQNNTRLQLVFISKMNKI